MPTESDNQCGNCGVDLWGPLCPMKPMTDGLGNYWMARTCPNCEVVLSRIFPGEDNELRDDLRKRAVEDPNPPARSEIP